MTESVEQENEREDGTEVQEPAPGLSLEEARASIEALLYASGEPLPTRTIKKALPEAQEVLNDALESLKEFYDASGRGLQLIEVAGGWQITTRPEYHECVSRLFDGPRPSRLSIQALETLAVIAYRQPATIPEIMELRGVRSAGVVRTLLERKLVKILGRKKVVGHPLLYGTTKEFLVRFGLKNVKDLPQLKDMSEVFGDEVAQQLETLDQLEQTRDVVEIEPLSESESTDDQELSATEEQPSDESTADPDDAEDEDEYDDDDNDDDTDEERDPSE